MERMAQYVHCQMYFEQCTNSFLCRLFLVRRSKELHHTKRIRVYSVRLSWGKNRATNSILHPENVAVDRNKPLYPNDHLHVPRNVLN